MTFDELNLSKPLLNALSDLELETPTSIQQKVFSVVMSGRDVVGIAQTGTGKTFAYLLPVLRQWKFSKDRFPQILIVVPTRELVLQVVEQVEKLTPYMNVEVGGVYGGVNMKRHIELVDNGLDVLVATPGRLLDLALNGVLRLKTIKKFVIDEMDEMLNLGFRSQLNSILDLLPEKRQNLLFSATITEDVDNVLYTFFNNPEKIEAAPTGTPLENIDQSAYNVPNFNTKVNLLRLLLQEDESMSRVLVFAGSKKLADELFLEIHHDFEEQAGVIHSNKAQNNRFKSVNAFQDGTYRMLIATDIIARGIDISEVTHVINFDTPDVAEAYMHRIGRTGRAAKKGISITFVTEKEQKFKARIEELMNMKIPMNELPEHLEISDELTEAEMPSVHMPNMEVKAPRKESEAGPSFHEKKDKNKKVNGKVRHKDKLKAKYKKPKTRGQKQRGKKNRR